MTHILKEKFRMKMQIYSSKKCSLHSENIYKLPVFRTNFLKLKFWKLLSNSYATFNLENVNLLSNPSVNPQNGVAYKKKRVHGLIFFLIDLDKKVFIIKVKVKKISFA